MRYTLALVLATAVVTLAPASSARAQAAYAYDSYYYNLPSGASYWYSSGYAGMYTDPATNSFAGNQVAPFRAVAPYGQPPTANFSQTDGLAAARAGMGTVTRAPGTPTPAATVNTTPVRVQRRGLFGRLRTRR